MRSATWPGAAPLGDWDAAEAELDQAVAPTGWPNEYIARNRAWLAALRGDAATAGTLLAGLR